MLLPFANFTSVTRRGDISLRGVERSVRSVEQRFVKSVAGIGKLHYGNVDQCANEWRVVTAVGCVDAVAHFVVVILRAPFIEVLPNS